MTRSQAAEYANKYKIDLSKDFYTLSAFEVGRVLEAADEHKYRRPRNANGSRGRYFFAAMQRAVNRK